MTDEILKMKHFDHPNVMTLIGVCVSIGGGPAIICQPSSAIGIAILHGFCAGVSPQVPLCEWWRFHKSDMG